MFVVDVVEYSRIANSTFSSIWLKILLLLSLSSPPEEEPPPLMIFVRISVKKFEHKLFDKEISTPWLSVKMTLPELSFHPDKIDVASIEGNGGVRSSDPDFPGMHFAQFD